MSGSGSHQALALGAGIERLKKPLGFKLEVCELPKFGRVGCLLADRVILEFLPAGLARLGVGPVVSGYIPGKSRSATCQAF